MAQSIAPDFRDLATKESERFLAQGTRGNILDSASSLCLRIDGDPTAMMYKMTLIPFVGILLGVAMLLLGIVWGILILTPVVDATRISSAIASGGILLGAGVIAAALASNSKGLETALINRLGARLKHLEGRVKERYPFTEEDAATYKKLKIISEDYATGGLDRRQPGLLLEGMRYCYVIRPNDVMHCQVDKRKILITYRVQQASLRLALSPLTSDFELDDRIVSEIKETFATKLEVMT